ncbi:MAG: ligand-binding sensor domain-containing protein [Betaproteobacteria bacterium]
MQPYTHYRVGNNSVTAIYADRTVMWVGTSGGIVRYDTITRDFKKYDASDGLQANGILCLGKVQGRIAIGTYGGGLSLYDEEGAKWTHYGVAEGLSDSFVYDVLETSTGDVWIATGSGVSRVRNGVLKDTTKWDHYTVSTTDGGLPNDRVYRIAEGRDGSIWLATRGGVANFRNGNWKNWTQASGLGDPQADGAVLRRSNRPQERRGGGAKATANPDHIAALEVGKEGNIWIGMRGGGVARFDGMKWTSYTMSSGLPSDYVSALHFDRHGHLWVGTTGGLAVYRDGKFHVLTTAQGLLTDNVLAVTTAMDDDVWVGTFGGVAHLQRPVTN